MSTAATQIAQVRTGGIWTFLRLLRESPKLTIGIAIFTILLIAGIFAPQINHARLGNHKSTELGIYNLMDPPSWKHPLGTDNNGRDELALLFTGLRNSLWVGLIAGGLATGVAVAMATIAGYLGGRWEVLITTAANSIMIIPSLPIITIIVLFVFRVNLFFLALVLAIFSWAWPTRVMTPQIRSLRERPYIDLAKVSGFSAWSIMFREIVPNFLPFIILGFTTAVSGNILAETGLRLLGLGPATVVSLGMLIQFTLYAGTLAQGYYLIVLSPIVLLILIFVSLNLINFGLEEVYNPRLKKITGL